MTRPNIEHKNTQAIFSGLLEYWWSRLLKEPRFVPGMTTDQVIELVKTMMTEDETGHAAHNKTVQIVNLGAAVRGQDDAGAHQDIQGKKP